MRNGTYPTHVEMANGLREIIVGEISPDSFNIVARKIKDNVEFLVCEGLKCRVKYRRPREKEGIVEVIATLKEGKGNINAEKEFDTDYHDGDIHDIADNTHRLPLQAFKSAVQALLAGLKDS